MLVTQVPPIAGVEFRAEALAAEIDLAFPRQAVHLIGHSMGGLDARRLVSRPDWAGRVLSLTTVATPHRGSALADLARIRVRPVYRLFEALGIDHRGFLDVTRGAAARVLRSEVLPSDLPVYCVAGVPRAEQVCWPLRRLHQVLLEHEGPNDGLVARTSALGFGTPLPDWPVDHLRQMNWFNPATGNSSRMAVRLRYAAILENLAEVGFARPSADEPRWVSPTSWGDRVGSTLPFFGHGSGSSGLVQEYGHGHVAEYVGSCSATVEKPVDREQDGNLVGWKADGGEDQWQGHEAS